MRKRLITAALLCLVLLLMFGAAAFADTLEEPSEESVCQTIEEQIVEEPQEETIPEGVADSTSVQSAFSVPTDNEETEAVTENKLDGSSAGNYYIKFSQTTDEGEKTCQFYGGSDQGIPVKDILNALQIGTEINENSVIDVVEDSVDTTVIGVRKTDNGIYITDHGMFSKADKDLVILVDGVEISLSVFDDISYLTPVYIDDSDVTKGIQNWETKSVSAEEVTDSTEPVTWGVEGESTWYAVTRTVTLSQGVICKGTVNLILCDGTSLEVTATKNNAGILVSGSNSLTVYAQSTGENAGKLSAKGGTYGAGIGGGNFETGSNITINGGIVTATGGSYGGAGIGGGNIGTGSNITINGGTVTATGGLNQGAGIGGGNGGTGNDITINGGTVTANGGKNAAGIGGGDEGAGSNITINDGTVTSTGDEYAAGIGGGNKGSGSNITISGGTVSSTGGTYGGAGIGGGDQGNGYNITINNGDVTATGGTYGGAGIGGGDQGNGYNITINNGDVIATGGSNGGAGIGGGNKGDADIIADATLLVFAGQNDSNTTVILHNSNTDLSNIPEFINSNYVHIRTKYHEIPYLYPVYKDNNVKNGIKRWDFKYVTAEEVCHYADRVTLGTDGETTWYVVTSSVKFTDGVICRGNVHLILCNGTTFEVESSDGNAGILCDSGDRSLTIYAQSMENYAGVLIAKGGFLAAGIGGCKNGAGYNITINGGTVTAYGGEYAAAIGGGCDSGASHCITINGGTVTAIGNATFGNGIGTGSNSQVYDITINGGIIIANGGTYGSGIGCDRVSSASGIRINGGTVTATGGIAGFFVGFFKGGKGIYVTDSLEVFAGDGEKMVLIRQHDIATDLSKNSQFVQSTCVKIFKYNHVMSATNNELKVIQIDLDSLSEAQKKILEQILNDNNLKLVSIFKVFREEGFNDQENINFNIGPELLKDFPMSDLRLFKINGDNTVSEVSFTPDKGKYSVKNNTIGIYFLAAKKNK